MYRVAYHALKNRADAEDVMQTALLRLLECKTDFESDEHIRRWLIRVTVNEARKVLRTPWRKRVLPLEEARDAPVFDAPEERELFSAVMALPRSYRMAVYLFYYENLSTEEIAAAMSAKPVTVRSWLMRARRKLRQQLTEEPETASEEV
ncbi:MAG TPA: sigma-70 family RNA polymerase sigma factor [Firmicutes bacterium]|nr:sigma-70 family RNA polymerase sigma factor [Bacillota bacterium]